MSIKTKYSKGIKLFFGYLKRYRKTLIYLSILSVFAAITNSATPYLAGRLIDALIGRQTNFIFLLCLWLGVKLFADVTQWRIGVKSEHLEADIDADYISTGVARIVDFPLKFHKSRKMGEIFDRISRAAGHLSNITCHIIIDLAPEFLSIFFAPVGFYLL